ncbi:MAG: hypothetical protein U0R51_10120 [Solirubrobacterales bacterium]
MAIAAVGLLAAAAPASAESTRPRFTDFVVKSPATNGYRVAFFGLRDGDQSLGTMVVRGNHSLASYTRLVKRVSARRISADLGRFGQVSMSFRRDGPPHHRPLTGFCSGYRTVRTGTFTGRFHFDGRNGYTAADGHRLRGTISVRHERKCGSPDKGKPKKFKRAAILGSCTVGSEASLLAFKRRPGAPSQLGAFYYPDTRRMAAFEATWQRSRSNAFVHSRDFSRATLTPKGVFSGSASFADGRLSGDLKVGLLGATRRLTPGDGGLGRGNTIDAGSCGGFIVFSRAVAERASTLSAPAAVREAAPRLLRAALR